MHAISLHAEAITLNPGVRYYVIDALYVDDIRKELERFTSGDLNAFIREKVFSYVNTPFAIIDTMGCSESLSLRVEDICAASDEIVEADASACFITDTGLILFVREEHMLDLIATLEYDALIATQGSDDDVNLDYWNRIASRYPPCDIALMLAPGVRSGHEFIGSGRYVIAARVRGAITSLQ